jgi:hypothetical protein
LEVPLNLQRVLTKKYDYRKLRHALTSSGLAAALLVFSASGWLIYLALRAFREPQMRFCKSNVCFCNSVTSFERMLTEAGATDAPPCTDPSGR